MLITDKLAFIADKLTALESEIMALKGDVNEDAEISLDHADAAVALARRRVREAIDAIVYA